MDQQQPTNEPSKPALRKLRSLSGYNMWHSECFNSPESRALLTLGDKNKKVAESWRELSSEQKETYRQKASVANAGSGDYYISAKNQKAESKRICSYLQNLSDHANMIPGFHLMFVAVYDDNHMVGGTKKGADFLRQFGYHIPYSFLGYLSSEVQQQSKPGSGNSEDQEVATDNCDVKDDKNTLRRSVEDLFNHRYGECIGDLAAKLPYKKIEEYGIVMKGLPLSKQLKHPSSYGRLTLKQILDNKESIKVEVRSHPQVSSLPTIGTTTESPALSTMATEITHEDMEVASTAADHTYSKPIGSTVHLLVNGKVVGMGTTKEGNILHGAEVPSDFVIVSVDRIDDNVCPMYATSFDEPFLTVSQYTAWPVNQVKLL